MDHRMLLVGIVSDPNLMPKSSQVSEKLVEVHSRRTQKHVCHISFFSVKPIPVETVLRFQMTNAGLGAPPILNGDVAPLALASISSEKNKNAYQNSPQETGGQKSIP